MYSLINFQLPLTEKDYCLKSFSDLCKELEKVCLL
jgi:hypothetical protein